jgi:hypothetical protein
MERCKVHTERLHNNLTSKNAVLRTDVSEERSSSIRVKRICELGTTLTVTSNRRTLRRNSMEYYYIHYVSMRKKKVVLAIKCELFNPLPPRIRFEEHLFTSWHT